MVTVEIKDALAKACREAVMTESEFISVLLEVRFGGVEHATKLYADRIKVVAGIRAESGS